MSTTDIDLVLSRLEGVRKEGTGWMARCPVHDDRSPSLHVWEDDEGRIAYHCFAGCDHARVRDALGLADEGHDDDYPSVYKPRGSTVALPIIAKYRYTDEHGRWLYTIGRTATEPSGIKHFPTWRPDPADPSRIVWGLAKTRRVLYRLSDLVEAAACGFPMPVYVCEGEKDVESVEAAGGLATCNPHGAGKWRDEYAEYLRGADVIVIADADDPGRAHAQTVARSLSGVAKSVRVVEAAVGKDASDHLAAGKTLDELVDTTSQAGQAETPADPAAEAREHWLAPLTAVEWAAFSPERPDYALEPWLVRGYITDIVGREKGGKSTFVASACASLARGLPFLGRETEKTPVIYLYESSHQAWRHLMEDAGALGCDELYAHLWPMLPPTTRGLEWPDLCQWVGDLAAKTGAGLVVFDILPTWARLASEAENDPGIARTVMERLRLLAVANDIAVWTVRHMRKGFDDDHLEGSRGTGAWIGSVDISMGYRKPTDAMHQREHPTRRIISSVGRSVLPPETIVDFDQEHHVFTEVGTPAVAERADLRTWLLDNLPEMLGEAIEGGWSRSLIKEKANRQGGFAVNRVTASLDALVSEGLVRQHRATGNSGVQATFYTIADTDCELR
ncbi:MAG: AAA family ATPase [Coriobacteriales bacterium]